MNVCISSHHLEMTEALESYLKEKLEKIWSHFDVVSAHFRLVADKSRMSAQADIHLKGKTLHVEEVHEDMYAAIDRLVDALHQVLKKAKEKARGK